MYLSNYHSHSTFCDGRSSMEDLVRFALSNGLKKFGFSSHAPLPFFTFWNMKLEDMPEYVNEYYRLKTKYEGRIELFLGLEADYIHGHFELQQNLYDTSEFEYKIASIHYLDPLPQGGFWCIDGKFSDFYAGMKLLYEADIHYAVKRFFDLSAAMIDKGGFDIVGHFDKIALNASRCAGFSVQDKWYSQRVGELLEQIQRKGLILEVNTKSLREKGFSYPDFQFLPLIKDLNIPVTVNSDCHYPTNVTDGFHTAYRALKQAGIRTTHQLVDGKWTAVEIEF